MRALFLLAGAAALGVAAPAAARPKHGHDHGHAHAARHAEHHAKRHERRAEHRAVRRAEHYRSHDYDRHWRHDGHHHHARWARGQRYRPGYAVYYSYGRIPWRVRHEYRLSDRYRYYYSDGYVYVVDPRTMLIEQVIAALL
jgi:hypothetical protein